MKTLVMSLVLLLCLPVLADMNVIDATFIEVQGGRIYRTSGPNDYLGFSGRQIVKKYYQARYFQECRTGLNEAEARTVLLYELREEGRVKKEGGQYTFIVSEVQEQIDRYYSIPVQTFVRAPNYQVGCQRVDQKAECCATAGVAD